MQSLSTLLHMSKFVHKGRVSKMIITKTAADKMDIIKDCCQ